VERRIRIILLESSLELVPESIRRHPKILETARRYGIPPSHVILDKSLHYDAMSAVPKKWKRGRPDIIHTTLLILLDSMAYRTGSLEVYMHTISGEVYAFAPNLRIPRNYERFKGLMAQLLRLHRVPPSDPKPLIWKAYDDLEEFVDQTGGLLLLWEKGEESTEVSVVKEALEYDYAIGIGAFPSGDFEDNTLSLSSIKRRLVGGIVLPAWSIACRILSTYENIIGVMKASD